MNIQELRIGNLFRERDRRGRIVESGWFSKNGVSWVSSINNYGVNEVSDMGSSDVTQFKDMYPIDLTEEWLLKLGFHNMPSTKWSGNGYDYQHEDDESVRTDYVHKDRHNYVFISHEVNTYKGNIHDYGFFMHVNEWYERCTEGKIYTQLKHVHQLQNLYFALTGQELEVKP